MEATQQQKITIYEGSVNRMNIDNLWNKISLSMGLDESKRCVAGILEVVLNNLKSNSLPFPAVNPEIDFPWSAGDLSDELMVKLDKTEYEKVTLPSTTCVEDVNPGKIYTPHENMPVKAETSLTSLTKQEARGIIHEIKNGPRKYCFLETRALATLTRVIQDFYLEMQQKEACTNSFVFQKYPLRYPKGCEAEELQRIYKDFLGVQDIDEFQSRAALDFLISLNLWTCMKYNTLKELVVAGSLFCLTTFVDYVGEADDACCGAIEAYCDAVGEGLSLYTCADLSMLAETTVVNAAFLALKSDIRNIIQDTECLNRSTLPPPTPVQFMEARWWDGALPTYIKVPVGLASLKKYTIPLDKYGSPVGTRKCLAIRNAIHLLIRYNEVIDVIHDIEIEAVNEIHVASRHGDLLAVRNYGGACAASLDLCALCSCEDPSHDWATDIGVGAASWYAIAPRYKAWPQLAEMCSYSAAKYEGLIKSSRHSAFVTGQIPALQENTRFWDENWKSMVKMHKLPPYVAGECEHCRLIEGWVVGRCLYRDAINRELSVDLIQKHVHENAHMNMSVDMSGFWGKIVAIAVGSDAEYNIVQEYCQMAETVWERLRYVLKPDVNLDTVMKLEVDTWFEIDKLMIKSHNLNFGYVIRRALIGVLSLQLERTDVAIYPRTLEGIIAYSLQGKN